MSAQLEFDATPAATSFSGIFLLEITNGTGVLGNSKTSKQTEPCILNDLHL